MRSRNNKRASPQPKNRNFKWKRKKRKKRKEKNGQKLTIDVDAFPYLFEQTVELGTVESVIHTVAIYITSFVRA